MTDKKNKLTASRSLKLTKELDDRLAEYADQHKRSINNVVNLALEEFLDEHEGKEEE